MEYKYFISFGYQMNNNSWGLRETIIVLQNKITSNVLPDIRRQLNEVCFSGQATGISLINFILLDE